MDVHTMILIKTALQIVFFVALAGCTTTVLLSWIKLLRDALSKDEEEDSSSSAARTQRRPGAHTEL